MRSELRKSHLTSLHRAIMIDVRPDLRRPGRHCHLQRAAVQNRFRNAPGSYRNRSTNLRTAQDRLVQTEKLASLGQLTAGIAHEIKNPLNFVNNFSALSAELTDELNDVLKQASLSREGSGQDDRRIDENAQRTIFEKVVQHGKRADSIVKNMLLHSREGSGEHRPDRHQCAAGGEPQSGLSRRPRREAAIQCHAAKRDFDATAPA